MKRVNLQNQRTNKRRQGGFTLIEIIAVVVLLGILAAVAVPKYMDMTDEAAQKSVAMVKSEMQARVSQNFGQALLTNTAHWIDPTGSNFSAGTELGGDFTLTVTDTNVKVKVNSVNKCYDIPVTKGVAKSVGGEASVMTFGDISAEVACP